MEQLERFQHLFSESQGQNLAVTVSSVPHSLGSGESTPLRKNNYDLLCKMVTEVRERDLY